VYLFFRRGRIAHIPDFAESSCDLCVWLFGQFYVFEFLWDGSNNPFDITPEIIN
jgi:hypothetical protein